LYQYGFLRCLQGHFDHSRRLMQDALEQCTALTPVHQRRYLHLLAAIAAALARDPAQVRAELSAASELTLRHGMSSWLEGYGNILNAWIALESGHVTDDEVARLAYGIERLEASGTLALLPLYLTWLATALSLRGRLDEARQTIDRASTLCDETHQGWCEAEVWRVRGELHLQAAPPDLSQATRCFSQALALARSQGAKLWELRVAADLTRLAMSTTRAARS
jgi:predicted ATPase